MTHRINVAERTPGCPGPATALLIVLGASEVIVISWVFARPSPAIAIVALVLTIAFLATREPFSASTLTTHRLGSGCGDPGGPDGPRLALLGERMACGRAAA